MMLRAHFWLNPARLACLEVVWSEISQPWPSCCFSAKLEVLDDVQSTLLGESCMIGFLVGGVLEQNQTHTVIVLLLCQVGGVG